jgi:hypothetical protein
MGLDSGLGRESGGHQGEVGSQNDEESRQSVSPGDIVHGKSIRQGRHRASYRSGDS